MPHRRSYSVSKWLRLATLEPLRVPDAFGEMVPHLASFTNSPVDPSGSVSKPPSANQEENITGERIEATQQRRKGDYMSFVFTGYFKKKTCFVTFLETGSSLEPCRPCIIYLFIYLFIYLIVYYLFIYSFIYFNIFCLFVYLFIYLTILASVIVMELWLASREPRHPHHQIFSEFSEYKTGDIP